MKTSQEAEDLNLTTGIQNPSSQKGLRCIVLGAGSIDGWVHSATRVYIRGQKNPEYNDYDYHLDVNGDLYEIWINSLIEGMEEGSFLVLDNASYHSRKGITVPKSGARKHELIDFLKNRMLTFH